MTRNLLLSQMVHPVRVLSSNLEGWQLVASLMRRTGWVCWLRLLLRIVGWLLWVWWIGIVVCRWSLSVRWSSGGLERYWRHTLVRRRILGGTRTS